MFSNYSAATLCRAEKNPPIQHGRFTAPLSYDFFYFFQFKLYKLAHFFQKAVNFILADLSATIVIIVFIIRFIFRLQQLV